MVHLSLCDFQMQAFTAILTNKYGMSTVEVSSVAIIKLEVSDDGVFLSSDYNDKVCLVIGLSHKSPSFLKYNSHSFQSLSGY